MEEHSIPRFVGAFLPFALPFAAFVVLAAFGPFKSGLRWQRRDRIGLGLLVMAVAVVDAFAALGPRGHLSAGTKWTVLLVLLPAAALCVVNTLRTFAEAFKANARLRATGR